MGVLPNGALKLVWLLGLLFGLLSVSVPGSSYADDPGGWSFTIQPYLWAPTIEGDLKFSTPTGSTGEPEIEIDPDDYFENIDIALIVTAMARKGKWSLTADFVYMEVSSSDNQMKQVNFGGDAVSTSLDIGTDVETTSFITTFGGGYQVVDSSRLKMDVVAGLRYLWLESNVDWRLSADIAGPGPGQSFPQSGSMTQNDDVWDAIGGLRGQIVLGDGSWFIPFYGDIGTGDSDLTWSVFAGIGYSFNDWFDAMIGYRHMEWDNDGSQFIRELRLSGPIVGARFNF